MSLFTPWMGRDLKKAEMSRIRLYENRTRMSAFFVSSLIFFNTVHLACSYYFQAKLLPFHWFTDIDFLAMVLLILAGFRVLPYSPRHFGFNLNQFRLNLLMGVFIGSILLGSAALLRMFLVRSGFPEYGFKWEFSWLLLRYPLVSFAQEAVIKGYFQSYFIAIFGNRDSSRFWAILFSSLTFAQYHIVIGIPVFFATLAYSILTGWFYEKSRSLVGVTLIHFLSGTGLLFFTAGPI